MGQCGCGETSVENAYKLPKGTVIGYDIYRGCAGCFAGPAISIYVYPNAKSEWLSHAKIEDFTPDEYGGNHGHGINVAFFEVEDLKEESVELAQEADIGPGDDQYATIADWLDDYGLRLVQGAMRRFTKRMDELERRRKK